LVFLNPKNWMFEAREIPTGKILFQMVDPGWAKFTSYNWKLTPDGKTRIEVNGQVHAYDNLGNHRQLNLRGASWPVLSFDSRYLLVNTSSQPHPWLGWIWNWFGSPNRAVAVLYDLQKGAEIASFANASASSWISQDNRKLATVTVNNSLTLNIYDLPPSKPWGRIVGYALSVAGGVFLVGLLCGFLRRKKNPTISSRTPEIGYRAARVN
jgi:hypothetical protein